MRRMYVIARCLGSAVKTHQQVSGDACFFTLPYLTLPYLTLPYLTLPYLTLPYLTLPYLTLPYLTLPWFTLNPLLLHSREVTEEGSQSLTRVLPISQILVNVTLKLVDACGHNSTSRSVPRKESGFTPLQVFFSLNRLSLNTIKNNYMFLF